MKVYNMGVNNGNSEKNKENLDGKIRADLIKQKLLERYKEKRKLGLQLYLRLPHRLPETEKELWEKVKELIPLAIKVRKPRQKYARFCLIDFKTREDRDVALDIFQNRIKCGELLKCVICKPRVENEEFVQQLVRRKLQNYERRRLKMKLKKAKKRIRFESNMSTCLNISNVPVAATVSEIRELFPNAVDIQIKAPKRKSMPSTIATIIFPTVHDIRRASKQSLVLHGRRIHIKPNLK